MKAEPILLIPRKLTANLEFYGETVSTVLRVMLFVLVMIFSQNELLR